MEHRLIETIEASDRKVRTASVTGDGTRTSFKFDAATWAALDAVAAAEGMTWVDWSIRAIQARPNATSKASAIRYALADALLSQQYQAVIEENMAGHRDIEIEHPIIGKGYYCLDDETLAAELDQAKITDRNDGFEGFTLIVGYRNKSFGGNAFVCIENRLKNGFHLLIVKD